MRSTLIITILIISHFFLLPELIFAQKEKLILGDWVEVRRESREGFVFGSNGVKNEPNFRMSFYADGNGEAINTEFETNKTRTNYLFHQDSMLIFTRVNIIVKLDRENLVLIMRANNKFVSDNDWKSYFIRETAFNKLSQEEKKKLAAPTPRDLTYRDSVLLEKQKRLSNKTEPEFYQFVEKMPEYPGGIDSLNAYFKKNIKYPATNGDCIGKTFISFIVEKSGKLSNLNIDKSSCPDHNNEVIKAIEQMPTWIPGKQNGEVVRVKVNIPVQLDPSQAGN